MWSLRLLAVGLCCATVLCGETGESMSSGMRVIYSAYRQCEQDSDPLVCLKARAVKLIDRALSSDSINVIDGVTLIKNPDGEGERSLGTNELVLEEVPADLQARANKIDDILWNRLTAFAQTHSVQFKVPEYIREAVFDATEEEGCDGDDQVENDVSELPFPLLKSAPDECINGVKMKDWNNEIILGKALLPLIQVFTGRGKKKKLWPMLMLAALFKGSMLHMAIKGLAVLAAKALMVSKLALLLAGIVALKKLFGGGGGHEKTTYEIVKQPIVSHSHQYSNSHDFGGYDGGFDGGHGGYGRSLDTSLPYPHRMAYRAHVPAAEKTEN